MKLELSPKRLRYVIDSWKLDCHSETRSPAQSFTDELLAELTLKKYTEVLTENVFLEVTINLPKFAKELKGKDIPYRVSYLKQALDAFCKEFTPRTSAFVIEYCKSGLPHLHAFVELDVPCKVMSFGVYETLRMFSKVLFLKLPEACYKQWASAEIDTYFRRFRSPAVCINMKSAVSSGWIDYMNKNAL